MHWPYVIQTERLFLRQPVASDAPAIFDGYARDPDVVRYLTWRPHRSIDETFAFLDRLNEAWSLGTERTWALTLPGEDRVIGMIGLRPHGYKADFGYVLAKPYWGRGLMTEAVRAVVDLAFADPLVHRVWAVCDTDNIGSARVLEKAGLAFEGILRRWIVHPNVGDTPRDSRCYARVREAAGSEP